MTKIYFHLTHFIRVSWCYQHNRSEFVAFTILIPKHSIINPPRIAQSHPSAIRAQSNHQTNTIQLPINTFAAHWLNETGGDDGCAPNPDESFPFPRWEPIHAATKKTSSFWSPARVPYVMHRIAVESTISTAALAWLRCHSTKMCIHVLTNRDWCFVLHKCIYIYIFIVGGWIYSNHENFISRVFSS